MAAAGGAAAGTPLYGMLLSLNPSIEHIRLDKRQITLGRAATCDVQYDDVQISKQHCQLICSGDGVYAKDLSSNGTWLNRSHNIGKSNVVLLRSGDEVSLILPRSRHSLFGEGLYSFVFQDQSQPATEVVVHEMAEAGVQQVYKFLKKLGAGSFGTVWLATDSTGQELAVKVVDKRKFVEKGGSMSQIFDEVSVMNKLSHPNVLAIRNVFDTPNFLVIALDLCTGGDLADHLKKNGRLEEPAARLCFHQILTALEYLHAQGVVHRDLKPENVLVKIVSDPPTLLLSDFGLAKVLGEKCFTATVCGTPLYIAPEVLSCGISTRTGYGPSVDLWSAGIILYQLLTGSLPYRMGKGAEPLFRQIAQGLRPDFKLTFPDHVSEAARDLISHLVTPPQRRITAEQALLHPWFGTRKLKARIRRVNTLARSDTVLSPTAAGAAPVVPEPTSMDLDDEEDDLQPVPVTTAQVRPADEMDEADSASASASDVVAARRPKRVRAH